MKTYCRNCGSKIDFLSKDKPKFCHNCGKPLDSKHKENDAVKPEVSAQDKTNDSPFEDEESTVGFSGDLQNLVDSMGQLNIELELPPMIGERMGSIMGTSMGASQVEEGRIFRESSREDFLKEFQKEAGTLKQKTDSPKNLNDNG